MPDAITEGPWIDLMKSMGARGVAERYQVTGETVKCRCLYHGETEARVLFRVVVPSFGGGVGRPVLVAAIQVWCWPACGYRLAWGS